MSNSIVAFSEMILVLGLVVGFGIWELSKLKRDKKK